MYITISNQFERGRDWGVGKRASGISWKEERKGGSKSFYFNQICILKEKRMLEKYAYPGGWRTYVKSSCTSMPCICFMCK